MPGGPGGAGHLHGEHHPRRRGPRQRQAVAPRGDHSSQHHAGADTIVLPAGVFKITLVGASEDGNVTGDFDITDSLTIQGAGAGLTIIDGQQLDRVFDVFGTGPSSIKVVLQGLTIRNGLVAGDGGGIRVGNADLVVRDCVVTGNRASRTGGGISNGTAPGTGNVTLVRTTVGRNVAGTTGGGISATGSSVLTVKDSTVRRNVAASVGGGIYADTATLTNCTVSGNSAGSGGGGIYAGTATLTNCTVSGNSAGSGGGGIAAGTATTADQLHRQRQLRRRRRRRHRARRHGDADQLHRQRQLRRHRRRRPASTTGTATLTNCTVSGNSAHGGGGVHRCYHGTATLTNCTVSGNSAHGGGGGIGATTARRR